MRLTGVPLSRDRGMQKLSKKSTHLLSDSLLCCSGRAKSRSGSLGPRSVNDPLIGYRYHYEAQQEFGA
jgi:hypothetical protein